MNTKTTRPIVGRRARPAKAPLGRDAIAEAALRQLALEGPSGLTLRKVAAALDAGPASLYVYIDDVDELRSIALDRALANVELSPASKSEWRPALKSVLRSYLGTLYATPGLGQLAMAVIPTGPNALRLLEAILARLAKGGVGGTKAAWGADVLMLQCAAVAAEQDLRRTRQASLAPVVQALEEVSPETFPNIAALRSELTSGDGEARLEWALDLLIDGLLNAPTPVAGGEGEGR